MTDRRPVWTAEAPARTGILVVGGGFSGRMLARRLAAGGAAHVTLVERDPDAGPGPAYGACAPHHLLNVAVDRMGAEAGDPAGFQSWLRERGIDAPSGSFVPRRLYGTYLDSLLADAQSRHDRALTLVRAQVTALRREGSGWRAALGTREMHADAAALCLGFPPGKAPWSSDSALADRLVANPWDDRWLARLAPEDRVVVVGSGLTAVDVLMSLQLHGHRGAVTVISLSGRLPPPHDESATPACRFLAPDRWPSTARGTVRMVREHVARAVREGSSWPRAMDALRAHTPTAWRALDRRAREQFMRHGRMLWELHRHRAPRKALAAVDALAQSGALRIRRARIRSIACAAPGVPDRGMRLACSDGTSIEADWLVNCTGPATRISESPHPLLQSLLRERIVVADPLDLGLACTREGVPLSASGAPVPGLAIAGALRRGECWETTGVTELRDQVAEVAALMLGNGPGGSRTHTPV